MFGSSNQTLVIDSLILKTWPSRGTNHECLHHCKNERNIRKQRHWNVMIKQLTTGEKNVWEKQCQRNISSGKIVF